MCTSIQGISAQLLGGSICQSVFICQVLCTGIQGIYAVSGGVHLPKCVHLPSVVYWYSRHLCCVRGVHLPKQVHLPSIVYWYSRQLFSLVFKATSLASRWGVHQPKKVHLLNLSSLAVLCFASQKVFLYFIRKT